MATEVGALPDDALAAVFRGLSLRSLAVVRCVCKAWRDVVDVRALLLPHLHLLPRTVRGVFINYRDHEHPHYFARPCSPSTIPRVDGTLSFMPKEQRRWVSVLDHCRGLLLLCGNTGLSELCVCNPATRRWTVLPRWWATDENKPRHPYAGAYIAFDPAQSSQYEVILVPVVPKAPSSEDGWSAAEAQRRALLWDMEKDGPFCLDWLFSLPEDGAAVGQCEFQQLPSDLLQHDINDPCGYMECPPAPWMLRVFSSSTGQWERRAFVQEGFPPVGWVEKMRWEYRPRWRYAVYHRGSLYVHRDSFVARFSLTKSKYQIIEAPGNVDDRTKPYLGKLQNAVCFGIVRDHQLKIWVLNESCGYMQWVLKYETVVGQYAEYLASITSDYSGGRHDGAWTIEENTEMQDTDNDVESLSEEENIEIQDSDHDVETQADEENIGIQDIIHDVDSLSEEENTEIQDTDHSVQSLSEEGHEWDSDNDDTFTYTGSYFDDYEQLNIIGFHPYKEVVFMVQQFCVVAYHLNSTKVQYLGNSRPKYYYHSLWNRIYESFPYTPCMIGDLLHGDLTGGQSSSED